MSSERSSATHMEERALGGLVAWGPVREEAFSFYTHAASALVALLGLVLLVLRAQDPVAVAAFGVYGGTLVLTFVTSSLHHLRHAEEGLFRKLDMTSIYLFIAGTYTPVCVLALPRAWGVPVLALVWTLALAGVALRWWRAVPRWATAGLYLGLGWVSLVGIYPLWRAVGAEGVALVAGGGVVYTIGAVVYARRRPDPWPRVVGYHGLWHVFVMVAAALHFALVWSLPG